MISPGVTWWRRRSLRARLTVAAVLVIALALVASAALLSIRLRSSLVAGIDETAINRAEGLAAALVEGADAQAVVASEDDDEILQVVRADGALVASSVNVRRSLLVAPAAAAPHVQTQFGVALPGEDDENFRVATLPVATASNPVFVQVGLPLDDVEESVTELRAALALGVPSVVAVLAGLTWVLVGRALRPVEALRHEAAAIPGAALDQRLHVPPSGDELARLAATFNGLLARVESATARQREFLADAAHEIRSPLASLRTQLEVAALHPRDDWEEALPGMLDDAQRLSRLVDDLLRLARLDARSPLARDVLDLDDIVLNAAHATRRSSTTAVDTSGVSAARVVGDSDALTRVVHNLLDNAVRHARETVTVTLRPVEDRAVLTVRDDGPGVPADKREHVFERFTRLDDARTRDTGGAGLGLAIVRDVVTRHGGTVRVEDARPGARFVVELPLTVTTGAGGSA